MTRKEAKAFISQFGRIEASLFIEAWYGKGGMLLTGPEAEEHEILETVKMICLN